MKTFAMAAVCSALLFTGVAFAAGPQQDPCQAECLCSQENNIEKRGSIFKPLFPEYEVEPPLGG